MRLRDFKVLSFDCYGTLVDWESGLWAALQPLRARADKVPDREAALAAFARAEARQQTETPSMPYSALLGVVHATLAREWGATADAAEAAQFGASVPAWPVFADTPAALVDLKRHYRLVILSNVDRASFAGSAPRLGVAFDDVLTAEEIGSYKPEPRNFSALLARLEELGFGRGDVLHVAQSLFHDHGPANAFGLASAWIDRRGGEPGGATVHPETMPHYDFRFGSLAELAAAREREVD